ncbi:MAG: hypothetical protein FJZ80_05585 [Bacteroidetes bacterium]|nr:hypothetical protein [Bacteroidota bacterium]MBM3424541.1 hypothetical protein [Bacteroidota bacterium]
MGLKFVDPEPFIEGYETSRYRGYETNDCVVKALAILFGISYDEAHGFARGFFSRDERAGTHGFTHGIRTMMRDPSARFYGTVQEAECYRNETIATVQKAYPKGVYLVDSCHHVSVLCDGVWVDYAGLITPNTRVNAVYHFSRFEHYTKFRAAVRKKSASKVDWLSWILAILIAYALIFHGDRVKKDLLRLKHWIQYEILG